MGIIDFVLSLRNNSKHPFTWSINDKRLTNELARPDTIVTTLSTSPTTNGVRLGCKVKNNGLSAIEHLTVRYCYYIFFSQHSILQLHVRRLIVQNSYGGTYKTKNVSIWNDSKSTVVYGFFFSLKRSDKVYHDLF